MVATKERIMMYQAKNYDRLLGMKGFSDKLLKTHFKLYEGYVTNTNTNLEKIDALVSADKERSPEFSELRRRFGWEFNGMRLHEYYFDNLGGKEERKSEIPVLQTIKAQYGSFERWQKDFNATGAMRGIGWAITYFDRQANRLLNTWIDEHNVNHLAGNEPLLVLDVFEHAYMTDYGTDKPKYMEAFFQNLNWDVVNRRFVDASASSLL